MRGFRVAWLSGLLVLLAGSLLGQQSHRTVYATFESIQHKGQYLSTKPGPNSQLTMASEKDEIFFGVSVKAEDFPLSSSFPIQLGDMAGTVNLSEDARRVLLRPGKPIDGTPFVIFQMSKSGLTARLEDRLGELGEISDGSIVLLSTRSSGLYLNASGSLEENPDVRFREQLLFRMRIYTLQAAQDLDRKNKADKNRSAAPVFREGTLPSQE